MRLSPAGICVLIIIKKYIAISALRRNYIFRTQERRFCRGKSSIGELSQKCGGQPEKEL